MHVCMTTSEFPPYSGGVGYYVYNLSKNLILKGHKVTVLTRGSMKGLRKSSYEGIEVYRLPFLPIYPFHVKLHELFQSRVFAALERVRDVFDIVHVHYPLSPNVDTSLPIMMTVHTVGLSQSSAIELASFNALVHKIAFRAYSKHVLKMLGKANLITTVSRQVSLELQRYYGLDSTKIVTLGNGVDTLFFTPKKIVLSKKDRFVLYTGRLYYRKGLVDLIQSARFVCQKHPDVKFLLTGQGPLEGKLKKLVRKYRISGNFLFLGYVSRSRLLKLYQNATVYVLPTYYEGLPTSLLEAMSCRVPVVTTPACNIPEMRNGYNGLIIPPKKPDELSKAILELLEDEVRRDAIAQAGREMVENTYSWARIANRAIECYEIAVNNARAYALN